MSTAVVVADYARAVVYTRLAAAGQIGINVHFLQATAIAGVPTYENQCTPLAVALGALYIPLLNGRATYRGVTLQRWMAPLPLAEPVISALIGTPGTGGGTPLPTDVCGAITWRTGVAGRRFRGRSYVPFPASTDMDADGSPTAGYITRLQALVAGIVPSFITTDGGLNGVTWTKQVMHVRVPPGVSSPVTSGLGRKYWNDQHRRGDHGALNPTDPWT